LAVDDGYIPYSPCNPMANIRYEEEKREAIPAENISWLINHPEFFPDTTIYDFFIVTATTGMRRGEVLGITQEKLYNGTLTIDQQYTVKWKFQPPKKGIVRVIPLANITRKILESRKHGKLGHLFPLSHSMVGNNFSAIRLAAMLSLLRPTLTFLFLIQSSSS
jgi:integrase